MNRLLIIQSIQPSEMDLAMVRLADWMGVKTKIITLPSHSDWREELKQAIQNGRVCVAAGADTLAKISEISDIVHTASEFADACSVSMLVYGIRNASLHTALLESLGVRCIHRLHQIQGQPLHFRFSTNEKVSLQQLTGLDFSDGATGACDVFEIDSSAKNEAVPLLLAEDHPIFIRTQSGRGTIELYLWATNQIADVGASAAHGTRHEDLYQWLLPAIIYLKACFGLSCWHNPNVRANLIIDDPLLHPQYGFLRYDALLQSMQRVPYGTSLAFIPWNYRRSKKDVVDLFQANKNLLSLCIHGCDHTNHEFDSDDEPHLTQIAALALERMNVHHERSGLLHEKVMVFPQGSFSSYAIRALRSNGFMAVVNSSCYPTRENVELPLGDLMLPAVCRFHGFPIFLRRNPERVIDIAVDLFLGRAGFVVKHHEFVQDGYGKWEQFAARMNALDERLSWGSLIETIMETCLQKMAGDDAIDVRLFTPIFKWTNRLERSVLAHFSKFEPELDLIKEIRVNGQGWPFSASEGHLYLDVVVEGETSIMIEILDKETQMIVPFKPPLGHQIGVGARRLLSEFRDDTLARHPTLLEYAKGIARHLKLTGDSR